MRLNLTAIHRPTFLASQVRVSLYFEAAGSTSMSLAIRADSYNKGVVVMVNSNQPPLSAIIRKPGEARVINTFGHPTHLLLNAEETGGAFSMFLLEVPPQMGPPPHVHENEDEWFLALDDQIEFFLEGSWSRVPAGTAVFMPRGSCHCFRNWGDTMQRLLVQTAPGGVENFFEASVPYFERPEGPDLAGIVEMSKGFGITYPGLVVTGSAPA